LSRGRQFKNRASAFENSGYISPTRAPPPLLSQKSWSNSVAEISDQNLLLRLSATRIIKHFSDRASDAQHRRVRWIWTDVD